MTRMVTKSPKAAPVAPPGRLDPARQSGLDRWFEITHRGSSVSREVRGGLVTFFAMAYILALNPIIIGAATDKRGLLLSGQPKFLDAAQKNIDWAAVHHSQLMVAGVTALVAAVMTIAMGVWGRYPLGIATGLGLNALIAYTIAPTMTWPQAMGLVVWEGIGIAIAVMTGFRQAVFKAVPPALRTAISVGIGLFITFVGLMDSGIVRKPSGSVPVELGINGSLQGWPIAVVVVGFFIVVLLFVKRVRGAMLIAIVATTLIAVVIEALAKVGPMFQADGSVKDTGWQLNVPALPHLSDFGLPKLGLIGKVDLFGAFAPDGKFHLSIVLGVLLIVFSLMLADFFDTMGTVVAIGQEGGLLNNQGNPPHLKEILLVDALAAVAGGLGSSSSNTAYIESASGVGEGARTGLASVVTGAAFIVAMFLTPLVNMVPSEAVAPVLALVGFLMMTQVLHVRWDDVEDGIPAFLTIVLMPFTYSITVGIGAGFITYALIKLVKGKARMVHPLMWGISVAFVIYFAQGILSSLIARL